jgi:antitoxin component YwqK of YwqJK toxin-antitoxin module
MRIIAIVGVIPTLGLGLFWTGVVAAKGQSVNVLYYNGVKFDDRYSKPEHFTGEMSYRDLETGKVTSREQYVNGETNGPFASYRDGRLEESGTNRHGKRHGVFKRWNNQGMLQDEWMYVDGERLGVQKDHEDGVLKRVYLLIPGKPTADTSLTFNKKGQLTQLQCGQHSIGKQDAEWCGMNGKQSTVSLYTDDGKVSSTVQYLWGKEHGTEKSFDVSTGKVRNEKRYVRGVAQAGGERAYDKSGAMLFKSDCDDQRGSCTETEFFDGGKEVQTVTVWKKGKIDKRTERYQNGKVREEMIADKDHFVISRYDDEAKPVSKGSYISAPGWSWDEYVPDGTLELFMGGVLWRREQYKAGVRQGLSQEFWVLKGHHIREDSEYAKDEMLRQKVYIDEKLAIELEYMPDGSLKSKKQYAAPPKGVDI